MKRNAIALLAAVAALAACGGDGGSGPSADDLTGTWHATKVEFVKMSDPGIHVDVIPLGATYTVTLAASHALTISGANPGEAPQTITGTWSSSKDVLTMSFTSGVSGNWQFDMNLQGNTLTLSGAHTDFIFDDQTGDEPALLNLTLTRS